MKKPLTRAQFAVALRLHQDLLGLTQPQMAAILGISPRTYWDWLNGKITVLNPTMIGALAILKSARRK